MAEFIGVKIFSLEASLGLSPLNLSFFGLNDLSFNMTAGVLLWPVVFLVTDIINEYFGRRGVRLISWLTAGLIVYAFLMITIAIGTTPAPFWQALTLGPGGSNLPITYNAIFGQGLWIIVGSLVAFIIGQLVDVTVFHRIRRVTGEHSIWLRATGSTLVSQLIDSFVVLFIAFYIGADWSLNLVLAICTINYIYKVLMALILIPAIYLTHIVIDRWLGEGLATEMKLKAAAGG